MLKRISSTIFSLLAVFAFQFLTTARAEISTANAAVETPPRLTIPGIIECEDFTRFADNTPGNAGGSYRNTDVDIQSTSDSSGKFNIGWIQAGEWLEYDLEAIQTADYVATVRLAAPKTGGRFTLEMDGKVLGGSQTVEATGDWQNWETKKVDMGAITQGKHTLRIQVQSGSFNINFIHFLTPSIIDIPGGFEMENYESKMGPSDTERNEFGEKFLTFTAPGDWADFNINTAYEGRYKVFFRAASLSSGQFSLLIDEGRIDTFNVPSTGDLQKSDAFSQFLNLPAGMHRLRIQSLQGVFNLSMFLFDYMAPPVLTQLTISPAYTTIDVNKIVTYSASGEDQYGDPISSNVSWSVLDEGSMSVSLDASVSPSGAYTAKKAGGYWVYARQGEVVAYAQVSVEPVLVDQAPQIIQAKTSVASSVEKTGFEASKATDGNAATRWSSAFADPQWIYMDLGTPQIVNKVVLNWENAAAKSYQIQVSVDAASWTTVYTTSTGTAGIATIPFASVNARYVRMYGTARTTKYGYSLYEFDVYGEAIVVPGGKEIPGLIEAEAWDGMSGLKTEACKDAGGGLDVGWADVGDWLEYKVKVTNAGLYSADYRVSGFQANAKLDVNIDGIKVGSVAIPNSGGYQTWVTVNNGNYNLSAGQHTIRLTAASGGFNFNWFKLSVPVKPISKKGIGIHAFDGSLFNAGWCYNWGYAPNENVPEGIEFVPMILAWLPLNEAENQKKVESITSNRYKHALFLNEPDHPNMGAISPQVESQNFGEFLMYKANWEKANNTSVNITIGSPALMGNTGTWLDEFMNLRGSQIGFIALHLYLQSTNVADYMKFVDDAYNKYKKPIWITEFAPVNRSGKILYKKDPITGKVVDAFSRESVQTFMKLILKKFDETPYVARYAWQAIKEEWEMGATSALFVGDGSTQTLTELGKIYASH